MTKDNLIDLLNENIIKHNILQNYSVTHSSICAFSLLWLFRKEVFTLYEQQFHMMGSRIRLRRKELGFTQIKLAELLDISSNHM